jgi:BirA family transcriptional regulator, biotin operon repressor / biotin---[acetyl-CoA-carboxylase] ligase
MIFQSLFSPHYRTLKNGVHFYGYDAIDSTNREANRYLEQLTDTASLSEGILFVSKIQHAGKGQFERLWESDHGGLYYTLLIKRHEFDANIANEALQISNIAATAIRKLTELPILVKAPNDLMLEGKKIGGILMEARHHQQQPIIIVGIGLNINQTEFSSDISNTTTSLVIATQKKWAHAPFISNITQDLKAHFTTN